MGRVSAVKHQLYLHQWAVKISECQNSGLTVVDWCRNQGVDTRRYYYWLAQLRKQTLDNLPELANISFPESKLATVSNSLSCQSDDSITFKKLEVTPPVPNLGAAVIVHLPNATLEVTNDASQRTMEAVLMALKSVC